MSQNECKKDLKTNEKQENSEKLDPNHNPAPDGGYGWVILAAAFFVSFILDGIMYSFGNILNNIKKDTDVDESVGNFLSSLNTGFLFCSGLVKQFGCRSVVVGGAIVTSLMYFITSLARSIYVMMAAYGVIGGISTGCTYLASLIIIPEYFDKKRGVATGITMAGSGVGSFVFSPFIDTLIKGNDWKFTMAICSCIILETCVFGALLKPLNRIKKSSKESTNKKHVQLKRLSTNIDNNNNNTNNSNDEDENENDTTNKIIKTFNGSLCSLNKNADDEIDQNNDSCVKRNKFLQVSIEILKEMTDFKLLFENKTFLLITMSNFFCFMGYFAPFLYLNKIAEENGTPSYLAAYLISTIGIVNIPFRMLFGFVADRKIISATNLNSFSLLVCMLSLFSFFILQRSFILQFVFSVIFAIGMSGMNCLTTMYLCEIVGLKKFPNANGIVNLFRGFGCFLGPVLAGLFADYGNIYGFLYSGVCFIVGFALSALCSLSNMIAACRSRNESKFSPNKNAN